MADSGNHMADTGNHTDIETLAERSALIALNAYVRRTHAQLPWHYGTSRLILQIPHSSVAEEFVELKVTVVLPQTTHQPSYYIEGYYYHAGGTRSMMMDSLVPITNPRDAFGLIDWWVQRNA